MLKSWLWWGWGGQELVWTQEDVLRHIVPKEGAAEAVDHQKQRSYVLLDARPAERFGGVAGTSLL
jgi:hypothetical protein